ncbi:MAG TPA: hypothetical protein VIZ66_10710 [Sphingomicrobium sp.]
MMQFLAFAAVFAVFLLVTTATITFFGKKDAKRKEDADRALQLVDALQAALKADANLTRSVCQEQGIDPEVLNLLFEVKRRELKGTADQMFSVRVSNFDGLDRGAFEGERYDYRTGKTHRVRKNRALKLALSDEARDLFQVHSRQFRGGAVLKGLSPSERGYDVLLSILQRFQETKAAE